MKARIMTIVLAFAALLFSSCDRSGVFETNPTVIPWNFCVSVFSDDNHTVPVSGADVKIFTSEDNRTNGVVFLSGTTNDKGEVLFSLSDFDKDKKGAEACKGNYYLKVTKGALVAEETTNYLLMNSGTTYHWVVLQ